MEELKKLEGVVLNTMDYLLMMLLDIQSIEHNTPYDAYRHGMKSAFVECLQNLLKWKKAAEFGFDWDPEKEFPV